jgi:hypothetical protein
MMYVPLFAPDRTAITHEKRTDTDYPKKEPTPIIDTRDFSDG